MKFSGYYFAAILLVGMLNVAPAQTRTDSIKTYNFDPIVITGTRIQQEKSKIASSISIIDKALIDESYKPNILSIIGNKVPGVFINERNMIGMGAGPAAAGGISIRGIGGQPNNQILILIDGQIQFMGMFGHPFPDTYMSSDIERVEVIRGPASILYGSNGFGGAINFITRKNNSPGFTAGANASYGSFNTKDISISSGIKEENYDLLFTLNNLSSDGFRRDGDSKFSSSSAYLNTRMIVNDKLRLSFDGNISDSKYFDPGTESNPLRNNYYNYLRTRAAISLDNKFDNIEGALKIFLNYGKNDFHDGWNSNDYNAGITFYQNLRIVENSMLTFGLDYKKFGGKGLNSKIPAAIKGLNEFHWIDETDLYFLYQYNLLTNFTVNGGIRFTYNSIYGNQVTPQAGFSYLLSENSIVKGSVGKAFRSPTILDLYLYPVSNASLNPEKLWSYELTYSQSLFQKKLYFELTGFYCKGSDMIQAVSSAKGVPPQKINTGSFINKGIELSAEALLNNQIHFDLTYNYLKSDVIIKYAPEQSFNIGANYYIGMFTINLTWKMVRDLYNNIEKKNKINFNRMDLSLTYKLSEGFKTYITSDNLLNAKYQIDDGYPVVPSSIILGFTLNY